MNLRDIIKEEDHIEDDLIEVNDVDDEMELKVNDEVEEEE